MLPTKPLRACQTACVTIGTRCFARSLSHTKNLFSCHTSQDRNYTIAYEVLSSTPAMGYTAAEGEMDFRKVTDGDATFMTWTTMFSNDADLQVMQDQKYKKIEFFADFKASLAAE
jgi:hypothetical protein